MDINIVKLKKYASVCSVLYVEDDEVIRTEIASFLGRFFPDVVLAEDGEIGLSKYKSRDFDVVITDINMPNMNGVEMIEAIKEINYEQIVLVTSAYNDSENLMKLLDLDINRFILKPFNNKQFLYVLYKIAEELSALKEKERLESELMELSNRSQIIFDQVDLGIVVLKENEVVMANRAFLELSGFDDYETLKLEMPDISVLFEEASHCISALSHQDFIEEIKNAKEENRKVRIIQNSKTIEYKVNLTEIEDEGSKIITFTDITALHNAMYKDENTKLPGRKFTLEKIELLKQKTTHLDVILMSIKHYSNLEKVYGKKDAIDVEIEFAQNIKEVKEKFLKESFIGHLGKNMFVVISPEKDDNTTLYKALQDIKMSNSEIILRSRKEDITLKLFTNITRYQIDTDLELNEIEINLIHAFDMM